MTISLRRATYLILRRELQHEFRSRQRILVIFLYAGLSTFVFSFALELDFRVRQEVVIGILWSTVIFASLLGFERSSSEKRSAHMSEALQLAPIPRRAILYGQTLSNWFFTLALAFVSMLVQSWLFDFPLLNFAILIAVAAGSFGIATVGTTLAAMTGKLSGSVGILGILMLPLILPVVITVVRMTVAARDSVVDSLDWLLLLLLQNFILTLLASWLYPYLIDE